MARCRRGGFGGQAVAAAEPKGGVPAGGPGGPGAPSGDQQGRRWATGTGGGTGRPPKVGGFALEESATVSDGPDGADVVATWAQGSAKTTEAEDPGAAATEAADAGAAATTEVPLGAGPEPGAAPRVAPPPTEAASVVGHVTWLMMHSPMHRHLFLTDLEWLLLPPLLLKQFRVYRRDKVPFAFVSWALMTAEVEERFRNGVRRLKPGDWNAGDRLWLIDFIAPFGGADPVVKDLREKLFPGREIKTLRLAEDGSGVRMETWGTAVQDGHTELKNQDNG